MCKCEWFLIYTCPGDQSRVYKSGHAVQLIRKWMAGRIKCTFHVVYTIAQQKQADFNVLDIDSHPVIGNILGQM